MSNNSLKSLRKNPALAIVAIISSRLFRFISDESFLKIVYWCRLGKKLDLVNPKSFNEKLQWLKLYNRNPIYTTLVDKYGVREYISQKIGSEYLIPLLGVWDSPEDIEWEKLPERFVLKCTHDSGSIIYCENKCLFDIKNAIRKLKKCLKRNPYWRGREWPYLNVKPRVIAEKYMVDESGYELKDYKVFNFDGKPEFIEVDYDRYKGHKRNLYNTRWEYMTKEIEYPTDEKVYIKRPDALNEMLDLSRKLSRKIPFVRCDFYVINEKIYFGEMTFFHASGFQHFRPEEFGIELGSLIELPRSSRSDM